MYIIYNGVKEHSLIFVMQLSLNSYKIQTAREYIGLVELDTCLYRIGTRDCDGHTISNEPTAFEQKREGSDLQPMKL